MKLTAPQRCRSTNLCCAREPLAVLGLRLLTRTKQEPTGRLKMGANDCGTNPRSSIANVANAPLQAPESMPAFSAAKGIDVHDRKQEIPQRQTCGPARVA